MPPEIHQIKVEIQKNRKDIESIRVKQDEMFEKIDPLIEPLTELVENINGLKWFAQKMEQVAKISRTATYVAASLLGFYYMITDGWRHLSEKAHILFARLFG